MRLNAITPDILIRDKILIHKGFINCLQYIHAFSHFPKHCMHTIQIIQVFPCCNKKLQKKIQNHPQYFFFPGMFLSPQSSYGNASGNCIDCHMPAYMLADCILNCKHKCHCFFIKDYIIIMLFVCFFNLQCIEAEKLTPQITRSSRWNRTLEQN